MPRLLLVDDNPSIHKIAETLLAPTDIQLVCVESAQEALNLVAQGERFDVALLDIMMAGMDGWQLLDQFRMHPATAGMPIAMMAGVLDTVDPLRIEKASIQGFLKKPVELRDLGERVHAFLEARVEPSPSPFATFPAVQLSALPEYRKPLGMEAPVEAVPSMESTPSTEPLSPVGPLSESPEADLLVLTESDLWVETPGTGTEDLSIFAEIPPEESLDLEDLDLDSLKGMVIEPQPQPEGMEAPAAVPPPVIPPLEPVSIPAPALETSPVLDPFWEENLLEEHATQELPDLGPEGEATFDAEALAGLEALSHEAFEPRSPLDFSPAALAPDPDFLAGLGETSITPGVAMVDWPEESEALLGTLTPSHPMPPLEPEEELDLGEIPEAAPAPDSSLAEPALAEVPPAAEMLPPQVPAALDPLQAVTPLVPIPTPTLAPTPIPASADGEALVRAIASDPVLLDMLAKALVAKLSDQVLREIAWEVMPEVAERLQRH